MWFAVKAQSGCKANIIVTFCSAVLASLPLPLLCMQLPVFWEVFQSSGCFRQVHHPAQWCEQGGKGEGREWCQVEDSRGCALWASMDCASVAMHISPWLHVKKGNQTLDSFYQKCILHVMVYFENTTTWFGQSWGLTPCSSSPASKCTTNIATGVFPNQLVVFFYHMEWLERITWHIFLLVAWKIAQELNL